jgi:hypothetical protein
MFESESVVAANSENRPACSKAQKAGELNPHENRRQFFEEGSTSSR